MRGAKGILVAAVVALGAFFTFGVVNGTVNAGDCSSNSVIRCGTFSIDTLRKKYNAGTHGVKNIFWHFGITSDTINNKKVRNGYVTRGGDVVVDGKVVASNAVTAGRQYMPGSTKATNGGTTFYVRKPSVSFKQNSLSAYVFFNSNGTFAGAVIKDCGNPVKATNKVTPKKPQVVCEGLTATRISKSNTAGTAKYRFTGTGRGIDGGKVVSYTFQFSDGRKEFSKSRTVEHTFKEAGTHTVKLTVKGSINGKSVWANSSKCKVTIKVDKPEPKKIKVCDLSSKKVVTINEDEYDSKKHSKDLDDCKEVVKKIEVCELETKEIITIDEKDFDEEKHSKDLDDCKEEPKNPGVDINKTVNGKEHEVVGTDVAFTYEVTVTNTGDVDLVDAVVTDNAPEGVTLTGADKGSVAPGGASWTHTISKLAVGESMSFTLNAVVPQYMEGTLKNTVCVDTPTVPGDEDDCDDATVEVPEPGKVEVCEVETGETVVVTEEEAKDTSKYAPVDDAACVDEPEVPTTPETPETPVEEVPEELPQTGLAEAFSGVLGLGALTAATYYFAISRRS